MQGGYSEKKAHLDTFFQSIELKAADIKSSFVFRAFKNLQLSSANIKDQQDQQQHYGQNIGKMKALQKENVVKKRD